MLAAEASIKASEGNVFETSCTPNEAGPFKGTFCEGNLYECEGNLYEIILKPPTEALNFMRPSLRPLRHKGGRRLLSRKRA